MSLTSSGRGFAGVDVSNDDDINVHLFFTIDREAMLVGDSTSRVSHCAEERLFLQRVDGHLPHLGGIEE